MTRYVCTYGSSMYLRQATITTVETIEYSVKRKGYTRTAVVWHLLLLCYLTSPVLLFLFMYQGIYYQLPGSLLSSHLIVLSTQLQQLLSTPSLRPDASSQRNTKFCGHRLREAEKKTNNRDFVGVKASELPACRAFVCDRAENTTAQQARRQDNEIRTKRQ